MPVTMTKADVKRLQVDERKKMRTQQRQSDLMNRTRNIFKMQERRAAELKQEVDYTLEEFREWFRTELERGTCDYCGERLTIKRLAPDHWMPVSREGKFTLQNLVGCCQPCNFQKGAMSGEEFEQFQQFLKTLEPKTAQDIRRRLSIGGKFAKTQT